MRDKNSNNGTRKHKSIFIFFFVLAFGYLWGAITVYKQFFPFEQIKIAKNLFIKRFYDNNFLPENPNWPERREQFEIFKKQADVVMIGDSLTHVGHWDEIFPNIRIANRGIANDRTDDVIRRMDNIISINPKKAFIMIGINDFIFGRNVEDLFIDYKKIVTLLQNNNIEVFIQSTIECSKSICGETLKNIRTLNEKLRAYAAEKNITYININNGLTNQKDGLIKEYTSDGIHLLGKGYVIWSKTINPYIISN